MITTDRYGFRALFVTLLGVALVAAGCVPAGPDRTTGVLAAPPPPTDLEVVEVAVDRVDLRWADGSQDAEIVVSEYRVYRDGERVAGVDTAFHSDTGLQPETDYEYRVSAVDEAGTESDPSDPVVATTDTRQEEEDEDGGEDDEDDGGDDEEDDEEGDDGDDDEEDTTPPSRPDDLEGRTVGPTEVELSWDRAHDPESGIREYIVYRDGDRVGSSESTSFTDEDLEPDTTYEYRVSAVNGEGLEGERSSPEEVTTEEREEGGKDDDDDDDDEDDEDDDDEDDDEDDDDEDDDGDDDDDTPPSRPTQLQAKARSATRIDLSWEAAEDPESGIDEYVVYRQRHKAPGDGEEQEEIDTTERLAYSDTGLQQDTEYEYWVAAVNGDGLEGEKSDSARERTKKKKDET